VLIHTQELLAHCRNNGSVSKDFYADLHCPVIFELANPFSAFSCNPTNRKYLANSVAESLYLLSGMNGTDFIYPFRGAEGLSKETGKYERVLGSELRFLGLSDRLLNYQVAYNIRQNKTSNFVDQLASAVDILKKGVEGDEVAIQLSSVKESSLVYCAILRIYHGRLEMLVCAGNVEHSSDLYCKLITPFLFMHQIISELANLALGGSKFMVNHLYSKGVISDSKNCKVPFINTHDFSYPKGNLSLYDVDVLISIMLEFVGRLDENSLVRANPFVGDDRVQLWQDFAEVFRAWKAEQLGYKIDMEQNFYHPQLRFIYKGEAV